MSLLPDSATFHERVQELYVTFRGRGVSLSAKDVELVDAWAKQDVPFEVVARGIRKAAEAALWDSPGGEGALRNLSEARAHVKREIDKYLRLTVGQARPSEVRDDGQRLESSEDSSEYHLTRHKKLTSTLRGAARKIDGISSSFTRWLDRQSVPSDLDHSAEIEEEALMMLLRSLPWKLRLEVLSTSRRIFETSRPLTRSGRSKSRRFHRAAVLRRELEIPSFW